MPRRRTTLFHRLALAAATLAVVAVAVPAAYATTIDTSDTPPTLSTDTGSTDTGSTDTQIEPAPVVVARKASAPRARTAPAPPLQVLATKTPGVFVERDFGNRPQDMANLRTAIAEISRSVVKPHIVNDLRQATIIVGLHSYPGDQIGETSTCRLQSQDGRFCTRVFFSVDPNNPQDTASRVQNVAHEMGHAIGLRHTGDRTSLMYPAQQDPLNAHLTKADLARIKQIYP